MRGRFSLIALTFRLDKHFIWPWYYLLTLRGADDGAPEDLPDSSPDVLMPGEDEQRDRDQVQRAQRVLREPVTEYFISKVQIRGERGETLAIC